MVEFYQLTPERASELRSAWERVPLSAYGEKQRKTWERRNRMRSKAKHHDRLFRSLCEILGLTIPAFSDANAGKVCVCQFGDEELCEVCMALDNLGLDTYVSVEKVLADTAALLTKLDGERAAAQNGSTP